MQSIHATYQQGVFLPLSPVALPEGSEVELHIEISPAAATSQDKEQVPQNAAIPVEQRIAQISAQVPQEEWDALPADLTDDLDLHLYGTNRE
ncbi:antitoxin family protein [Bythopirellula goksoeyrii]|uniref:DUF104 domain-containing protein n=1 Tax=Bythopirellula goksoeyrii TaxID=1400387 RepID=A0A5B9Q9Q1_9BACT|nr:antitoxin family protein [Bythopirellula goksoeyrii]QEG33626.1 hypothetical protein Pr1d_08900 [Bythopirellula goksoeyrii]